MTLAFQTFMKQHEMTGSEKADGYSQDAFIGLDEHEKEIVFKLLASELPWSAKWLFLVNPEKAFFVAKQLEEKLRKESYGDAYMLQQQMVNYSGDLLYQEHMIEDYSAYDEDLKPRVVDAISQTPSNSAVTDFLKKIILTEVNSSAVARASRHLLNAKKIARTTEADEKNFGRMVAELRNDNMSIKLRTLAQIENM